jgi:hypothetical protein
MSSRILIAATLAILLITSISFHTLQGDLYASAVTHFGFQTKLHSNPAINPIPLNIKELHSIDISLKKIDSQFKQIHSVLSKQQQEALQKLLAQQHTSDQCGDLASRLDASLKNFHGPLLDPQIMVELQGIIVSANDINTKANSISHQYPSLQNTLSGIITNTNKIIDTACTIASCMGR